MHLFYYTFLSIPMLASAGFFLMLNKQQLKFCIKIEHPGMQFQELLFKNPKTVLNFFFNVLLIWLKSLESIIIV